jgi:hypothetical protein
MTDESVDPLVRLWTTSEAMESLRVIQDTEEPLDEVLTRVADTALNADAVTVTVLSGDGGARTAAATDDDHGRRGPTAVRVGPRPVPGGCPTTLRRVRYRRRCCRVTRAR